MEAPAEAWKLNGKDIQARPVAGVRDLSGSPRNLEGKLVPMYRVCA